MGVINEYTHAGGTSPTKLIKTIIFFFAMWVSIQSNILVKDVICLVQDFLFMFNMITV